MLPARTASATPQPRISSIVRIEMPVARGTADGPALTFDDEHPGAVAQRGERGREPRRAGADDRTSVVNMPPTIARPARRRP